MQGELADASIGEVCRGLAGASATGTLHVQNQRGEAALKFREGSLVAVRGPKTPARIGDRLVHAGLLSRADLERTVKAQQSDPHPTEFLGELLVSNGLVDAEAVRVFLQEQILDALVDVLDWPEGRYHFTRHEVRERGVIVDLPVERALSEATRRILESRQVDRFLPNRQTEVVALTDVDTAGLEPEERAVLGALEHGNTIEGAAVRLGFGERDTARIVWGLWLLGLVDVASSHRTTITPKPDEVEAPDEVDDADTEPTGFAGEPDDEPAVEQSEDDDAATPSEPTEEELLDSVRVDSDADEPVRRRRLFRRSD